ncbi:hypothetical protein ADL28_31950 [Streptomyces violaceusniger]|uniref:Uncharacterized protein n=1 Tax=Streptomyces violaceusniger TaxID=68280 RepID=A0A0X3VSA7_STRVO|nr:hypothetical protein ADL28_31950 [Streptomyces violaceusniger]
MTAVPLPAKTASNAAVNSLSRSRMRNRERPALSPRSMSRLRASWVTHAPVGWAVTPRTWTRRVAISMTKKTWRRLRKTLATCVKSQTSSVWAWDRRNARQVC